jgi:hypothetical protein
MKLIYVIDGSVSKSYIIRTTSNQYFQNFFTIILKLYAIVKTYSSILQPKQNVNIIEKL